jgi:hypothetical protein
MPLHPSCYWVEKDQLGERPAGFRKVDPSAVLQSRRDDRGPATPEDGVETLCIYECFAKRVSTLTALDKILKQIGSLLDDPSVTNLVAGVAESSVSWAEV